MRVFLLTASLLLTGLLGAPATSAGVVQFVDDTCDNLSPDIECLLSCNDFGSATLRTTCTTVDSVPFPPNGIPDPLPDADGDGIPDILEAVVCGSQLQRTAVDATGHASCVSPSDLVLDPDTSIVSFLLALVLGLVDDARDIVDVDRDGVPDAAEPYLCMAENQNFPQDGTCVGDDYQPPV